MNKKLLITLGVIILGLVSYIIVEKIQTNQKLNEANVNNTKTSESQVKVNDFIYEVTTKTHVNKKVKISYPQIINSNDVNKQKQINDLVENDILNDYKNDVKIVQQSYYNTYAEAENSLTEDVIYDVKLKSSKILSILYIKHTDVKGSAHPNTALHSTNINIETGTILRLKDIINIDNNFIQKLTNVKNRVWVPEAFVQLKEEDLMSVIENELKDSLSYNVLNSEKYSFYFAKDYFGMSTSIPHAIGDWAFLKFKYDDIKDNIKPESDAWKYLGDQKTSSQVKKLDKLQSRKQEFKGKLDKIQKDLDASEEKKASDVGTTNSTRIYANKKYTEWDKALNEIYSVLKQQLPSDDMKKLESEELKWIKEKEVRAEGVGKENIGGVLENISSTAEAAQATKERCYELVDKYMK